MRIPNASELMRPVLEAHHGGAELRPEDVLEHVEGVFQLSAEDMAERQPSGQLILLQRVRWARIYLTQLGLLEQAAPAPRRITPAGVQALDSGEEIHPPLADWAEKPVPRDAVISAIAEFDREGGDPTLRRHGYRRAFDYVVVREGGDYDSKALYGVAYGYAHPEDEPI